MPEPIMGGLIVRGTYQSAWTGGIPNRRWTELADPLATPHTPNCYRHSNPRDEAKLYSYITKLPDSIVKLERNTPAGDVKQTISILDKHLKTCGLDTVFYVGHPTDPTRMVSVIKSYVNLTIEHVRAETTRTSLLWDTYDRDNNKAACELVTSLLGPQLFRDITSRDPDATLPATMLWMHAMANRASLTSDQVEATKAKIKELTPVGIPAQDITKYATLIREYKLELDRVYSYDHSLTKNVLKRMSEVTVEQFRLDVFATLKRMEANLKIIKTMDYDTAEAHMQAQNLSIESIMNEFEPLYEELLTSNDWSPAMNKSDKKAPEINLAADFSSMTETEINAFIAKKIEAAIGKTKPDQTRDKPEKVVCFGCGQEGHKNPDCPNKDAPTVETLPATVAATDPQIVQFKGKWKFYCGTCHRWTAGHVTSQHKARKPPGGSSATPPTDTPPQIEANSAQGIEPAWGSTKF
jgi:hypothetical protein